ncbi:MAG: DcaP family trimeric outer membrane transporter [Pseudomonadota bacterium]
MALLSWTVLGVAVLSSAPALADSEIDALREQLEALTAVVEQQAEELRQLKQQQAKQDPAAAGADGVQNAEPSSLMGSAAPRQPLGRFPDDAIVTAGTFGGSLQIPGDDASIRLGGFVRLEGSYDFDNMGIQDVTSVRTIPLDGTAKDDTSQARFHIRNSRLNVDYRKTTALGPLRTFFEVDIFGGGGEFINNYELRVRHLAAQIGNVYVGQWWSYFDDVQSIPETSDFGGPLGAPILRNPGIRWAADVASGWRLGVGVENPAGDIEDPDDLFASDEMPDITGFAQVTRSWGRLRVAGVVRRLSSTQDDVTVGGINLSGRLSLPFGGGKDNIVFQAQLGEGFTHYYSTFAGQGLAGFIDADGRIEATGITSGYIAYQRWWSEQWRSTVYASVLDLDNPESAPGSTFSHGEYYAANLFWTPFRGATFGMELVHAAREIESGLEGDGTRFQISARVDF